VTVGRILRALVTMRGLVIEWVTVKAFHEDFSTDSGKVHTLVVCSKPCRDQNSDIINYIAVVIAHRPAAGQAA